jgi:hypothetical protein
LEFPPLPSFGERGKFGLSGYPKVEKLEKHYFTIFHGISHYFTLGRGDYRGEGINAN